MATTPQDREALVTMFDSLMALEEDAKAIKEEIKDTLETYAGNRELTKESVKDLFAKYKKYKKDPQKFVQVDFETDVLLNLLIPEYAEKEEAAA